MWNFVVNMTSLYVNRVAGQILFAPIIQNPFFHSNVRNTALIWEFNQNADITCSREQRNWRTPYDWFRSRRQYVGLFHLLLNCTLLCGSKLSTMQTSWEPAGPMPYQPKYSYPHIDIVKKVDFRNSLQFEDTVLLFYDTQTCQFRTFHRSQNYHTLLERKTMKAWLTSTFFIAFDWELFICLLQHKQKTFIRSASSLLDTDSYCHSLNEENYLD